jgi:hypothetical protein
MPIQLRLLAGFYHAPARTASQLLDDGSWWPALLLAALMCVPFLVLNSGAQAWHLPAVMVAEYGPEVLEEGEGRGSGPVAPAHGVQAVRLASSPLQLFLLLVAFAIPAMLCAGTWSGRHIGSFGTLLRRDFGAACTGLLMAFAASHVPLALAGAWLLAQPPALKQASLGLVGNIWIACLVLFLVFAGFVARALWGLTAVSAAACAAAGGLAMFGGAWIYPALRPVLWMLTSPCLLFYLWNSSQGDLWAIGNAFRGRGSLRRRLEAAAINPHDADAQYQLGLLLAERRQYTEALERFTQAVKIDSTLAEAHYELGRIAREQKRLPEAIAHLDRAAGLNDKLNLHEVWREIGATYRDAGMRADAEAALRKFVERRAHDPQGLYLLGDVTADAAEARTLFERAVAAAVGAPAHRQRELRHWVNLARKRLG